MTEEITKIGIIGAGQMGTGITHVCALKGINVYLLDISTELTATGMKNIESSLSRRVKRGDISEDEKKIGN